MEHKETIPLTIHTEKSSTTIINNIQSVTPADDSSGEITTTSKLIKLSDVINSEQPTSFTESITRISDSKGRYRDAKYRLLASVYSACHVGFKKNSEEEREENLKVLTQVCEPLNITGESYYQMLGKLAFGNDSKRASSLVHVIKVAESFDVKPEDFYEWIVEKGGIQAVRTTYRTDGTRKKEKIAPQASKQHSNFAPSSIEDEQSFIFKARDALAECVKATIPNGQLGIIEEIGKEAECTAILKQCADGSFVVKVVLSDEALVNSMYAAYGRKLPIDSNPT